MGRDIAPGGAGTQEWGYGGGKASAAGEEVTESLGGGSDGGVLCSPERLRR